MYVTTISIPLVFHADDDDQARTRLEALLEHFALDGVTLGTLRDKFEAKISDAPTADGLQESLRYQPLRDVDQYPPADECACSCHADATWTDPVCPRCYAVHST